MGTSGSADDVADALSSAVSRLPGGGELRDGQVTMALAVAKAIVSRRHLVVQAGTGTGKSLAYLVPAILSGRKVVVATATIALQDQLAHKDLPGLECSFAVLKGRGNYLCVQKASEVAGGASGAQLTLGEPAAHEGHVRRLLAWRELTATGDRADLDFEPSPQAWSSVSATSNECPGATRCPSGEACFAESARQRAFDADVVVVNSHLYMAHIASGSNLLPEHDVVIFDEAHELEDIATEGLGAEIGPGRFRSLARAVSALGGDAASAAGEELTAAGEQFDTALVPMVGRRLPPDLGPELTDAITVSIVRLARVSSLLREAAGDRSAIRERLLLATTHLSQELSDAAELGSDRVAWVEGAARAPVLKVAPLEVGPLLKRLVWQDVTAVLTSATIPAGTGPRLGLATGAYDELDVGSPFPFSAHALLYCAAHLPDRRSDRWEQAMHEEVCALIEAARGRTLALFTSWRAMEAAVRAARERVSVRVLAQADLPKPALIESFSSDESSCLFATMGFWQGLDVPGRSLSLVIIDRLPFPRPDEPLAEARRERAGPAAFRVVDLPRAAALLAQGAGRLIRSATDRGVVAVLDRRLATAPYRWDLVRALPPMARTRHLSEVKTFLAQL